MSYVRTGNLGGTRRLAGTNGLSRLGRLRGPQGWAHQRAMGFPNARELGLIDRRLRGLGYSYTTTDDSGNPITVNTSTWAITPGGPGSSIPSGGISAQDAALLSTAITTAGKVGTQAIIGTPTVSYNPATGAYTATGGATLPTATALTSELSSYLPLILLGLAAVVIIPMLGARR